MSPPDVRRRADRECGRETQNAPLGARLARSYLLLTLSFDRKFDWKTNHFVSFSRALGAATCGPLGLIE